MSSQCERRWQRRQDEAPISEEARAAINKAVAERRDDPVFQARLKRLLEENQGVLENLNEEI